jgi:hypothetical protein
MRRIKPKPEIGEYDKEILIKVRKSFWSQMSNSQRGLWAALWGQAVTYGGMSYKGRGKLYNMMLGFVDKS